MTHRQALAVAFLRVLHTGPIRVSNPQPERIAAVAYLRLRDQAEGPR